MDDYVNRSLSILDILDETPQISLTHNLLVNKHVFQQTPIDSYSKRQATVETATYGLYYA